MAVSLVQKGLPHFARSTTLPVLIPHSRKLVECPFLLSEVARRAQHLRAVRHGRIGVMLLHRIEAQHLRPSNVAVDLLLSAMITLIVPRCLILKEPRKVLLSDTGPFVLAEPCVGCLVLHEIRCLDVHQHHQEGHQEQRRSRRRRRHLSDPLVQRRPPRAREPPAMPGTVDLSVRVVPITMRIQI